MASAANGDLSLPLLPRMSSLRVRLWHAERDIPELIRAYPGYPMELLRKIPRFFQLLRLPAVVDACAPHRILLLPHFAELFPPLLVRGDCGGDCGEDFTAADNADGSRCACDVREVKVEVRFEVLPWHVSAGDRELSVSCNEYTT